MLPNFCLFLSMLVNDERALYFPVTHTHGGMYQLFSFLLFCSLCAYQCSMMALVFGCILTFFGFFNQCLCPLPCGQRLMDISGVGVQLSLALTWPMIRSSVCDENGGCRWGDGATALLLAQLFFFFASVFSRCMREPRYERRKEDKEEKSAGDDNAATTMPATTMTARTMPKDFKTSGRQLSFFLPR